MRRREFDRGVWTVALSALVAASSISLTFCPVARAHEALPSPERAPTEAAKTALTLQPDDDGDELLEHWSDPKFVKEERLQTVGIVILLVCAGGTAARRRRALRRVRHHG